MKKFKVTYTKDFNTTHTTEIIEAESFTDAYIKIYAKLPDGKGVAITDLYEVEE